MEKALWILKSINEDNFTKKFNTLKEAQDYFNEAISELEEAMKPKRCEGCKYDLGNNLMSNECYMCSRNVNDLYEAKETK